LGTTNTDETYDLNVGAKVSSSVPINLTSTSGTDNSFVNLTEGTNITLTRDSATEITIDSTYTYTLPVATTTVLGGVELGSDTALTQTYETGVTGEANRTYPVQLNAARQAAVSVPWVNTQENTTWTVRDSADF